MGPNPGLVPLLAVQRAGLGRLSTSSPQPLHLFWAPGGSTARWDEGVGSWVCLPGALCSCVVPLPSCCGPLWDHLPSLCLPLGLAPLPTLLAKPPLSADACVRACVCDL